MMHSGVKVRVFGTWGVGCAAALWAVAAQATPITVQNNSFESPYVASPTNPLKSEQVALSAPPWQTGPITPGYGFATGCGIFANSGTEGYTASSGYLTGMDGTQAAYIFPEGNYFVQSLVDPTTSNPITYQAGLNYSVSALVAVAQSAPVADDQLIVGLYYLSGGTTLLPVAQGGNLVPITQEVLYNNGQASANGAAINGTGFTTETVTAQPAPTAAIGQQIYVEFSTVAATDDGGGEYDVDNIQVSSSVPEPASLSAFAVGGTALLIRRRRR